MDHRRLIRVKTANERPAGTNNCGRSDASRLAKIMAKCQVCRLLWISSR